jgi:hypothetical protein
MTNEIVKQDNEPNKSDVCDASRDAFKYRDAHARRGKAPINSDVGIITPDTPLRLDAAVRLAFPEGGITVSGLRREIARGRLTYEIIAGKQFTTLSSIAEMRKLCRTSVKDRVSGNDLQRTDVKRYGWSKMEESASPQDALRNRLKLVRRQKQKSS